MSSAPVITPFVRVPTPCIGVCSTVIGDVVCRGCKRFSHEIIEWNSFSDDQKRAIDNRLEQLLDQVVSRYLLVTDSRRLAERVLQHKIRVPEYRGSARKAFELLRAGGDQLQNLPDFGLEARPEYTSWSPLEIKNAIDHDFWVLSSAHHNRYFR